MIDVSMALVHVIFGEGNQEKDLRVLDYEACVPNCLAEIETERRRYRVACISPPYLRSLINWCVSDARSNCSD